MRRVAIVVAIGLLGAACGSDLAGEPDAGQLGSDEIRALHDPSDTGEERPPEYRFSLPRDAIAPVYSPTFVEPSGVDWPDEELVIGVEFDGEARAYPVGFLTSREMVIDNHRGIPTLVTW